MFKKTITGKRDDGGVTWLITRYTFLGINMYERRVNEVMYNRYSDHITGF